MLTFTQFKKFMEKSAFLKIAAQAFEADDFLNIPLRLFWDEVWGSFFYKNISDKRKCVWNLSYHGRCRLLNSNPILVARHLQYQVEAFFKEIVVGGPFRKIKKHVTDVKFQVCGSPHVHCFLWVVNAPVLPSHNKEEYVGFVDQTVHAFLHDRNENPELHDLESYFNFTDIEKHVENIKMKLLDLHL